MLRFSLLGSGSSGNAALVCSDGARILIDAGFSFKQLCLRCEGLGQTLEGLSAVFVTHEHGDHVRGLGTLARRLGVPVYCTELTFRHLPRQVGELPNVTHFEPGDSVRVGDIDVASFSVAHDAIDPVSYTVQCNGARIGFAGDLGHCSQLVRYRLRNCHALVLEANYCPDRLRNGHYPPRIRQRIFSRNGHLSNQDMCRLLSELSHDDLQMVVLMHISENNNAPELVEQMAVKALAQRQARVHLALQDAPTPMFEVCTA